MTNQEVEQAVTDNQNLVRFVIKKFFPDFYDDEDVFQVGWIGLWKACISYDSSKSKFSTFAVRCIINEIRMELRSRAKLWQFGDIASLDEPMYFDKDGNAVTLAHLTPDPSDDYSVIHYDLSFLNSKLSERDIEVLKLNIYGFTTPEIGRAYGRTRSWASRIIKRAQAVSKAALA